METAVNGEVPALLGVQADVGVARYWQVADVADCDGCGFGGDQPEP